MTCMRMGIALEHVWYDRNKLIIWGPGGPKRLARTVGDIRTSAYEYYIYYIFLTFQETIKEQYENIWIFSKQ